MVAKKSKILVENQVIFYNGQKVEEGKNIKIVDKAIVHVVDLRNVGKNKIKLQVKRLSQASNSQSFEVDSNSSIDEFIQKQLSPFYQEPAEKLFFVYSGRQLKRQKSFLEQYVESDTQIICVHQQKDKKPNKKVPSIKKSSQQIKQRGLIKPKIEQTDQNKQREQNLDESKNQNNSQPEIEHNQEIRQVPKLVNIYKKDQNGEKTQKINQEVDTSQKKEAIQNTQQQTTLDKVNSKPDLFDKLSGVSSISEPNFKKKNKVKQIQSIKSKNDQSDSTPTINCSPVVQTNVIEVNQNLKAQETSNQNEKKNLMFKTRDQIFQSNIPTYASVIDEPQESLSFQVQQNNIKASGMSFYMSNQGDNRNHDQQIFDSGMNFQKQNNSKLQVKYNKGFMNLSNASLLQTSRPESLKQNQKFNQEDDKNNELKLHNNKSEIYLSSPSLLDYSYSRTIEIRENQENYQQNPRNEQELQKQKQRSKQNEESEDNLFIQIRRGITPVHNFQNDRNPHYDISQSNLLSDTNNHPNTTDMMNSFTFNLSQNPDQTFVNQRQSDVRIILEQSADEQEVSSHVLNSKRQSQVETNFKESPSPSHVQSQISRNNFDFHGGEHNQTETCSLIDNLMSMDDQKMNNPTEKQRNDNNNKQVERKQQEDSEIFVQFQQYRADTESQVHQFTEESDQFDKLNQLKQKQNEQFYPKQVNHHSYGTNISNDLQINTRQSQDSAIKIVEEDSLSYGPGNQQENFLLPANTNNVLQHSEADECSGTFQEVSYSHNPLESNFINNSIHRDPQEITFSKDQPLNLSNFYEPQGSKLLHELSLLAQNQPQKPQLLPGDYIYSTDLVETPEQALQSILNQFSHCF